MATINITVEDHSIRVDNLIELAQGSNNFDTCAFTFDSSWDGFTLYASMYQNPKNVFKLPLDESNTCKIPVNVLQKSGWLYIGARGEKDDETIGTSIVVKLPVRNGAVNGNETGQEMLDQSQYEYLLGKVNELNEKCESLTKELENDFSQLSEEIANAGSGMTATAKNAFLECFANVAWATADGQACYDKLKTALNESVGQIKLSSIIATCSETAQVGTAASDLDIVVTAIYSDGSSSQVTAWTTSGTVVEGDNTFTVTYNGKSTTVKVTGVDLYYTLDNSINKSLLMSKAYGDGGETLAGFPSTYCAWHFWGSKVVEQDTTVKIKYISPANNYNGVYGYCVNPETFDASSSEKMYYGVKLVAHAIVDTSYEWEYTIKAGYAFGMSLMSNSSVPTVEVVS